MTATVHPAPLLSTEKNAYVAINTQGSTEEIHLQSIESLAEKEAVRLVAAEPTAESSTKLYLKISMLIGLCKQRSVLIVSQSYFRYYSRHPTWPGIWFHSVHVEINESQQYFL